MPLENLAELMTGLGEAMGMPELALDDDGHCLLQVDKVSLNIEYEQEHDALLLSTVIGDYEDEQQSRVSQELLEANYLWLGTGGATFGVAPASRTILLSYRERLGGLDSSRFQQLLGGFVIAAEQWMERLATLQASKVLTQPVPAANTPAGEAMRV